MAAKPAESKVAAWRRLLTEGRWEDFSREKQRITRLYRRKRTRDEIFYMALAKFPKLESLPC